MAETALQAPARTRRSLLAAAAGSAAALAATALKPAGVAALPASMLTETDNAATAPTGVSNSTADSQAFFGHATGAGAGVEGLSVTGHGVLGISDDTSDPENNTGNAGVVGVAGLYGDTATNKSLTGVYGYSDPSTVDGFVGAGVWGDSADFGVIGSGAIGAYGEGGFGLFGITTAANGVGVYAASDDPAALALRVEGRAEFTRSGRGVVNKGKASKTVSLPGCTPATMILAVLAANRSGRWVRGVLAGNGSFTVYLNTAVGSATYFNWLALTNPTSHLG